jgi:pimeloyl-ACP methyl ester carboxylesterase
MPTADLGDVTIYYESQGSGEAVLLCPPSWWPSDTWHVGVVPFLSGKFRTIIFDCRGTGYSSKPDMATPSSSSPKTAPGCWSI